jgi:hypothetical protein
VGRRPLSRAAVLCIVVSSIAGMGLAVDTPPAPAISPERFAGMPAPEAVATPTPTATAPTLAPRLYQPTARIKPGSYVLRRFDASGAVVGKRRVTFARLATYSAQANERAFGGTSHVKLTSGPHAGWWVPVEPLASNALPTVQAPASVTLASGTVTGLRFFAQLTLRRSMWLPAPTSYTTSTSAVMGGTLHYLLADGPLAGRWVRASEVADGSPFGETTPAPSTTAPTSTASADPTSTDAAPTATPSDAPSAAPTETLTASPSTSPIDATPAPTAEPATTWKAIALIYRTTDVTFTRADGSSYRLQAEMGEAMYDLVRSTLSRTVTTTTDWSAGTAAMELTVVDVPGPLSSVEPLGSRYWVSPQSVQADMDRYAPVGSYDSIFVVFEPRDAAGIEIPIGGWGLTIPGGPWSNGAGFTSVMTPGAMWWWTNAAAPEEVFIHEWLHQVIFFHQDAGRMSLDLHAGREFGYDDVEGTWREWYSDIMQGRVRDGDRLIGLTREIWAAGKPTAP